MKAALWHGRDDVRVEEVPEPGPPGPGEVILRVEACGICGTDLEEYRQGPLFIPVGQPHPLTGRMAPIVLGHEFVGEVVEVGRGVTALRQGYRVAPDVLIYCGTCYWCRRHQVTLCDKLAALGFAGDGGLAQYCKVPASMCIAVPAHLPGEVATLAEPLSVAIRAVRKGRVGLGETVAVVGGGTIGLLCLQAARNAGASAVYIVEPHAGRRDLARTLGADGVLDPTDGDPALMLREATGIGLDVVIDASGSTRATLSAIASARKGGRIVLVGIPVVEAAFNFRQIVETEKEIVGSLSHVYDEDFATAVGLLAAGRVDGASLITDRIPLVKLLSRGLHRLEREAADTLKILVRPWDDGDAAATGRSGGDGEP